MSAQNKEDAIMATLTGDLGNNTLTGTDGEANTIYGDAISLTGMVTGGNDTLTGGANSPDNTIYGDAQSMEGPATGGNDTLIGGANSTNNLYGDAYSMGGGPSTGGNDILIGGIGGVNYMYGDAYQAGPGPQHGGDDRLVSADNTTDNMWGDFGSPPSSAGATFGSDTFVFDPNNGKDTIYDFQSGVDTIELDGFFKNGQANAHVPSQALDHMPPQAVSQVAGLETFSDLNIQVVGNDSVIRFDANDSVTVLNDTNLTASDFHFVA
jgi:hypothetical protein